MARTIRLIALFWAAISLAAVTASSQETTPSLGAVSRQQRQEKEQSKATPGAEAKSSKVITNEEIPERPQTVTKTTGNGAHVSLHPAAAVNTQQAERWKTQILAQKSQIASLQGQVEDLNESIRFAPANCAANCVGWNERQRQKQQRVERIQAQLEEQKRRLDDMQEAARKQGYGSSVYDP